MTCSSTPTHPIFMRVRSVLHTSPICDPTSVHPKKEKIQQKGKTGTQLYLLCQDPKHAGRGSAYAFWFVAARMAQSGHMRLHCICMGVWAGLAGLGTLGYRGTWEVGRSVLLLGIRMHDLSRVPSGAARVGARWRCGPLAPSLPPGHAFSSGGPVGPARENRTLGWVGFAGVGVLAGVGGPLWGQNG